MDVWMNVILTILKGWAVGATVASLILVFSLWLSSHRIEGPRPGSLDHFDELAQVERQVYDWRREGVL